jgi:conjugal transfer pilus assembly protein TraW
VRPAAFLAAGLLASSGPPAEARDFGQHGAVFPIVEEDLLRVIQNRLAGLQATGAIDRANRQLAARTAARVRRPARLTGIVPTRETRRWTVDPTVTVAQDLRDGRGRVLVRAGTRVNPLDTVPLRQRLLFMDGDDPAQVAWARHHTTALNAKLILVGGSPFDLMKAEQRRFYFDQAGTLTRHFGIRAVPALVEQQGRILKLTEFRVPASTGAQR